MIRRLRFFALVIIVGYSLSILWFHQDFKQKEQVVATPLDVLRVEVQEQGYKVEDWVKRYISGLYSECDVYTEDKLAYSQEIALEYGVTYGDYVTVLTAMTNAIKSIEVERVGDSEEVTLNITQLVYVSVDKPVYDETGYIQLVRDYRLGNITRADFNSEVDRIISDSLAYTITGNNVVEKTIQYSIKVLETSSGLKYTNRVTQEILNNSNILHNLSVYALLPDLLREVAQAETS